jgi:hypothetical protein
MLGYRKMLESIKNIKKLGYVRTHRVGNTGIGKTLEDLLGIKENNIPGPNGKMIELKSARKTASSMLTLFTKSPLPAKANTVLVNSVGYKVKSDRKELHTTLNSKDYNKLRGKIGLKIGVKRNKIIILDSKGKEYGYWDKEALRSSFERKLPKIVYVKAESKGSGKNEEFWFNEAWLLGGFSFVNFVKLLKQGVILVDIRVGQYANGKTHDHGTGFRVSPKKLELCFSDRKRII